jgi:hypothetical protein
MDEEMVGGVVTAARMGQIRRRWGRLSRARILQELLAEDKERMRTARWQSTAISR